MKDCCHFSPKSVSITGQSNYTLPYSTDIYDKMDAGELVTGCRDRFGTVYDSQVGQLAERIVCSE